MKLAKRLNVEDHRRKKYRYKGGNTRGWSRQEHNSHPWLTKEGL